MYVTNIHFAQRMQKVWTCIRIHYIFYDYNAVLEGGGEIVCL